MGCVLPSLCYCSLDGHHMPLPLPVSPIHLGDSAAAAPARCLGSPTGANVPRGLCYTRADGPICNSAPQIHQHTNQA